jgi:hypothetical protein
MKHIQTFEAFLTEAMIAANTLGSRIGAAAKGTTVIIDDVTYTCLGKGKWESSNDELLSYVEVGARASAKGTAKIEYVKK